MLLESPIGGYLSYFYYRIMGISFFFGVLSYISLPHTKCIDWSKNQSFCYARKFGYYGRQIFENILFGRVMLSLLLRILCYLLQLLD